MSLPYLRGLREGRSLPATIGALGLLALAPGVAQAATTTIQAEGSYLSPSTAARTIADSAASAGSTLLVHSNGAATRTITTSQPSTRIVVRARGQQCYGAPRMTVSLDGSQRLATSVPSTSYGSFTVDVRLPAGRHALRVAFTNDYYPNTSCDRNLFLDKFDVIEADPATAPVPTPIPTTPTPPPEPVPAPAPASNLPTGIPGTWNLKFADDFNGDRVDGAKWTANWLGGATQTTKPINSAELAAYAPSQATVSGGTLKLSALQASTPASDGRTYGYRSGMVQSNGKYNFTYGATEARVYSPGSSTGHIYNWPAFWTDGQNWPTDGEIDVFEGLGGQAAWHYHYSGGGPGATVPGNFTGWHTYGAVWEPGKISFYYDGRLVGTQSSGVVSSPHFLILNYGVGGWGGDRVVPATMQVDYVRAWQR
jgi:hypothetical protein